VLEGLQKISVFLPHQGAVMKEPLEEVEICEQSTRFKKSILQFEKEKLKMTPLSFLQTCET
jgi:hypothetical protein